MFGLRLNLRALQIPSACSTNKSPVCLRECRASLANQLHDHAAGTAGASPGCSEPSLGGDFPASCSVTSVTALACLEGQRLWSSGLLSNKTRALWVLPACSCELEAMYKRQNRRLGGALIDLKMVLEWCAFYRQMESERRRAGVQAACSANDEAGTLHVHAVSRFSRNAKWDSD